MPCSVRFSLLSSLLVLLIACAEPPSKEMNQAQGAIDAARAAGADRYAAEELGAAAAALQQSETAVAQNDYRLALSLAIDSRDRAQSAAKAAVERSAKARGDAERVIAETNSALTQARARLEDPAFARLPRRTQTEARTALDGTDKTMQEARAAVERTEYGVAIELATGAMSRIQETLAALEKAATPPAARKRR